MIDIKELTGKMWSNEKYLLYFEIEKKIILVGDDVYFEHSFDISDKKIVINFTEENKVNAEYSFELNGNSLMMNGSEHSLLNGEWKLAKTIQECPVNINDSLDMAIDTRTWMSGIDSSRSLKDMCIPGTHDSAAYQMEKTAFTAWTITQSRNFAQQLEDGIRSFDLRLSENMNFFHGKFYLCQNVYSCLDTMTKFLDTYPSETIIVTVKRENCDDNNKFNSNFQNVLNHYANYFYLGSSIPTLGEVRKKIVLLNRFDDKPGVKMSPWGNNATFQIFDSKRLCIQVQDRYDASYENKDAWLVNDFKNAKDAQSLMYITHFSLQSSGNDLSYVANTVQNNFINRGIWRDMQANRYIGIYVFDFYNQSLILTFIYTNYR